ncbi:sensor histidine kinase [Roseovarius sp.]|uniref:sensor histidine kinase n=1 Tax=Roseovarius sp. TaxID=1486281 RepID=UPI003D0C0C73
MNTQTPNEPLQALDDQTWRDVVTAIDRTYSELVDYQERLEAQNRELDEMRQFMASVLSSISEMLIVIDRSHNIERTGGALSDILGIDTASMIGTPLSGLLEAGAGKALSDAIAEVMRDRRPRVIEVSFLTPDGPTPLDVSVSPRLDQRGRSQGVVLVGRPLGELRNAYRELEASHTALQNAQAQLVQHEKLASLGRLVAGVAHELNNPISFVYANTHALEKYTRRFETYFDAVQSGASRPELGALRDELKLDRTVKNLRGAIDGAKDGAERVRDIVEDLRRLSADGTGEKVRFDMVQTARTAADWVVRGTKTPVRIAMDGAAQAYAMGNPGHAQQVVMNLVQNAIDALADTADPLVTLHAQARDGKTVLQVRDNGPGISESDASAIFDPFFTTKPVGKGTGLGLSISQKIAQESGGTLTLAATGPNGSCFELSLPAGDSE